MRPEALCSLALAAIDDADARLVLADAIDERTEWHSAEEDSPRLKAINLYWTGLGAELPNYTVPIRFMAGLERGARVIVAILLFGDWPESWPLARRCSRAARDQEALRARVLAHVARHGLGGFVLATDDEIERAEDEHLRAIAAELGVTTWAAPAAPRAGSP